VARQPNKALAMEIQQILDVPLSNRAYPNFGTKILKAVLQTIKKALLNGEKVYIKGFGTFKVVERTPRPTPNNILTNDENGKPLGFDPTLRHYRPRKRVIFEPSLPLMAMINIDSPNYKERRTARRWSTGA